MATIKDVAKLAGVSVSTVSIVMNGKAKERKIPQTTSSRVIKAMHELDYQPNSNARRLRSDHDNRPTVVLYLAMECPEFLLTEFFKGIRNQLPKSGLSFEIVFQPFQSGFLHEHAQSLIKNNYNAAVILGASQHDAEYLETIATQTPIVLINHKSNRHSTVEMEFQACHEQAAELLFKKNHRHVAIIASKYPCVADNSLAQSFVNVCLHKGIEVKPDHVFQAAHSFAGGYETALSYLTDKSAPKVIYCESDLIALGALHAFYQAGISVPGEIEMLCVGLMSQEHTQFCNPSLSAIALPAAGLASSAISILIKAMTGQMTNPDHVKIAPEVNLRDSFQI